MRFIFSVRTPLGALQAQFAFSSGSGNNTVVLNNLKRICKLFCRKKKITLLKPHLLCIVAILMIWSELNSKEKAGQLNISSLKECAPKGLDFLPFLVKNKLYSASQVYEVLRHSSQVRFSFNEMEVNEDLARLRGVVEKNKKAKCTFHSLNSLN